MQLADDALLLVKDDKTLLGDVLEVVGEVRTSRHRVPILRDSKQADAGRPTGRMGPD